MSTRRFGMLFAGVGVAVFLILGVIALGLMWRFHQQDTTWTTTTGTVVSVDTKSSDGMLYRPVVAYLAGDAQYSCVTDSWSSRYPTVGGPQLVQYDPLSPARCDLPSDRWIVWLLSGLGTFFLLLFGGLGFAMVRSPESFHVTGNGGPRASAFRGRSMRWHTGVSTSAEEADAPSREDLLAENRRLRDELRRRGWSDPYDENPR